MPNTRQALLINEPPIGVSPTLMWVFGTGPAVFLQQLHYFLNVKRKDPDRYRDSFIDGRYWVHWTMPGLPVSGLVHRPSTMSSISDVQRVSRACSNNEPAD